MGLRGIDTRYVWVDPYWSGPRWFGHVFLYEWPQGRVRAAIAKGSNAPLADLQEALARSPGNAATNWCGRR